MRYAMIKLTGISLIIIGSVIFFIACQPGSKLPEKRVSFSGIYPHLAYYNDEGECGTGAVVPWADRLWVITYGPHKPFGSSDKLYEVTPGLDQIVRPESVGGTPANRMIHQESKQLFIGPYAIDEHRNVRVIPYKKIPGRFTGNARHLTDPANKIYYATMEEGFYEVDVHTLQSVMLYEDGNVARQKLKDTDANQINDLLPGAHGKGVYSGQGVLVYSNNGEPGREALRKFDIESGVLAEWDGENWKVIRRNQFCEVTGPGGIYGNSNPDTDPIWATGFDHRSLIVGVRDPGGWKFFRLPKASHSYDGAHGWNTEWPRIRDVGAPGSPDYLMTMHGMFWRFPESFSGSNTAGIRPRSAYLKVIGDFARWNDRLVFGCDDAAKNQFLNKNSKVQGDIGVTGQSNSNLWFTSFDLPDKLGPSTAEGAVWLNDPVKAGEHSEPFLFAGWQKRCAWIKNDGDEPVSFTFEIDKKGNGNWELLHAAHLKAGETKFVDFQAEQTGEWIRARAGQETMATVQFCYTGADDRPVSADKIFNGLAHVTDKKVSGGLIYGLGDNRRALGLSTMMFDGGDISNTGYYELDAAMNLKRKQDTATQHFINRNLAISGHIVSVEQSSVLVVDEKGRRWRLPLGNNAFTGLMNSSALRIIREVATERNLFNCHGTYYELPAENADGFARIRPVASHNFRIHDYASYRGLLILTGIDLTEAKDNPHIIVSDDGQAAVWAGALDDLWKLGKPTGHGGPWLNSPVKAGTPSDPYLIGFFDKRKLQISHDLNDAVTFRIEVDPVDDGTWMDYMVIKVPSGETAKYSFPKNFQARWIRFTAGKDCTSTARLIYD